MSLLRIGEVFGHPVDEQNDRAKLDRSTKHCRFRQAPCNKGGLGDPLGICSYSTEMHLACVCPVRLTEDWLVLRKAAQLAFGSGHEVTVSSEVRLLRVGSRKVGKVDYLLGLVSSEGHVTDFAAVEVQTVYVSGHSIRAAFKGYLSTGDFATGSERRMDYRSSAQKRLMPQLNLKVPVFRRWGKRFFVVVDVPFFRSLPKFQRASSLSNSEVTWIVCGFERRGEQNRLVVDEVAYSSWDDVLVALREGEAPEPREIQAELELRMARKGLTIAT